MDRDCTVVAADAPAAKLNQWGFLDLHRDAELSPTSGVSIIQHPEGGYKQIALAGNIITRKEPGTVHYVTSTMPGSSGAPVFDDNWKVIALHQVAAFGPRRRNAFSTTKVSAFLR